MGVNVLNTLVCVTLDIRIWSGRKKLTPGDLRVEPSELPPQDLASLGSKFLCNPATLQGLHRVECRSRDACQRVGVRFLNGYGVPKSRVSHLLVELNNLKEEFQKEKQTFLAGYEKALQDWIAAHAGWEHVLEEVVPRNEVDRKLSFEFQIFSISQPLFDDEPGADGNSLDSVAEGLIQATRRLPEQLFTEISSDARDAWKKSFEGETAVTRKALRPLKAIQAKLELMKFLAPEALTPLVRRIHERITSLPKSGPIRGKEFAAVAGIIYALADMERLKKYVGLLKSGFPLDEGAFLNTQNVLPKPREAAIIGKEPHEAAQAILPLDEDSVAPPVETTSWFF
jgi:hypothetical protein